MQRRGALKIIGLVMLALLLLVPLSVSVVSAVHASSIRTNMSNLVPSNEPLAAAQGTFSGAGSAVKLFGGENSTGLGSPSRVQSLSTVGGAWTEVGPKPIGNALGKFTWGTQPFSGRVSAIAVNQSNPSIIYVGGAQGGVWRTTDGGSTFTPLADSQASLAVGAVTISPDGKTLYVGTGEPNHSEDSYYGQGLLKSTNEGSSWQLLGEDKFSGSAISSVVVDPNALDHLLVSTTWANCCQGLWSQQNPNGVGIFSSSDGGQTWAMTLNAGSYHGISQVVSDPANAGRFYAADFSGDVWESTDSGASWGRLTFSGHYQPSGFGGRVAVGVSPAGTMILAGQAGDGSLGGIYEVIWNSSNTFTYYGFSAPPNTSGNHPPCGDNGQCWYDLFVAFDPNNSDRVYFGGVDVYAGSVSSLGSWVDLGGYTQNSVHPDMHAIAFVSGSPGVVYLGNDGGLWMSTNYGSTWSNLNSNLELTQFQSVATSPTSDSGIIGGTQDNACVLHGGGTAWNELTAGDGGWTGYDSVNPNMMYCMYVTYHFQISTDGGSTWTSAYSGLDTNNSDYLFYAPLAEDPNNPGTIYIGSRDLYKTVNYASSWFDVSGNIGGARISAIAVAPSNSNVVYLGDDAGNIALSTDGGSTWTKVATEGAPVSSIAVDPKDYRIAYVSLGRFASPLLLKTTNEGSTWETLSLAGVPSVSINVVRIDPRDAFVLVGTDSGVYISGDSGATWSTLGTGLPNSAVYDIHFTKSNLIVAATHGRGVWEHTPPTEALKLSFAVVGGGTGYSAPQLSYVYNGMRTKVALSSAPTQYTMDYGTGWNVTGILIGSDSTQRWATTQSSGTVLAPQIENLTYYHQYFVHFIFHLSGGGSPPLPSFFFIDEGAPYVAFGISYNTEAFAWTDLGSPYSIIQQFNGSAGERWRSPIGGGSISGPENFTFTYYHQYLYTLSYSVTGGGAPSAPALASTQFGGTYTSTLTTSPTAYWLDSSASCSVPNMMPGSTSAERWDANAVCPTVSATQTINFAYYHQYYVAFAYSVSGGGSPAAPTVSYQSLGNMTEAQASATGTTVWADAGQGYSFSNLLGGSGQTERWITGSPQGIISSPTVSMALYYHQFSLTVSYSVSDSSSPAPPSLTSTYLGSPYSATLSTTPTAFWLDAGAAWGINASLISGGPTERWTTPSALSGTVASSTTVVQAFTHQFFVSTSSSQTQGGSISESGWHDAGSTFQLSANASTGWQFEGWTGTGQGSFNSSSSSASVTVQGTITESAVFYPGITITSNGPGQVAYSYEGVARSISGGSATVFVPYGSVVTLQASPSSFLYQFQGYAGGLTGGTSSGSVTVNSPTSVMATFGNNYASIGGIAAVAIGAVLGVSLLIRRRAPRSRSGGDWRAGLKTG